MRNSSTRNAPRSSSEGQYVETANSHVGLTHKIDAKLIAVFTIASTVISMGLVLENKLHPLLLKTGIIKVEAKSEPKPQAFIGGKTRLPEKPGKKRPAAVAKKTPPPKPTRTDKPDAAKHDPDAHLIPWIDQAERQER